MFDRRRRAIRGADLGAALVGWNRHPPVLIMNRRHALPAHGRRVSLPERAHSVLFQQHRVSVVMKQAGSSSRVAAFAQGCPVDRNCRGGRPHHPTSLSRSCGRDREHLAIMGAVVECGWVVRLRLVDQGKLRVAWTARCFR
ncbi:hypothetical protein Dfulv_30260 [Dactylosporangium fulvum]|uniref:Uncharacterized protein n=1 Tax=Dactylosporangium fulvum TaxID=53359 RepID=A0ABY5VRK5_9ACTN|nr:hypothetical protein [Dactylosporangium fulvum]UWP79439.1 hypothetical protein Dfulv_30260 [Dactylosporangium fulvum]